jgi:hypothetical protein
MLPRLLGKFSNNNLYQVGSYIIPNDNSALIILPFDTCNLCDRRPYASDSNNNNTNKFTV